MRLILSIAAVSCLHLLFYAVALPPVPAHLVALAGGCALYMLLVHRDAH